MPIHALTGPRIIRQCYALLTRQRQQQTAHTDAIHYLTNEPGGRPHFCEGQAVRKVPQCCRPTKKKRTPHRACGARRLRAEMHRHCQRPQGAVAPQVAPEDKGARLACGTRRLEGQDAVLQPLAAEEGVGVGLKPRRPDNAFVLHHAQMRKRIEEAQVAFGNGNRADEAPHLQGAVQPGANHGHRRQ